MLDISRKPFGAERMTRLLIAFLSTVTLLLYIRYHLDDALITLRYARDLTEGRGLVFNEGEVVQGFTSPFFCLFTAFLYLLLGKVVELLYIANVLCILALALLSYFLYLLMRPTGLLAATLVVFFLFSSQLLLSTIGIETLPLLAVSIAAIYFYTQGRTNLAFALLALATLVRPDSVILATILTAHFLYTNRRMPIPGLAIYLLILLPWYIFSTAYYGSPFPHTLQVKMNQGRDSIPSLGRNLLAAFIFPMSRFPLNYIAIFSVFGIVPLCRSRFGFFTVSWTVVYYIAYFAVLHVPSETPWYHGQGTVLLILSASLGLARIFQRIADLPAWKRATPRTQFALRVGIAVLACLCATAFVGYLGVKIVKRSSFPEGYPRYPGYRAAADWLTRNTPDNALIACNCLGSA